MVAIVVGIILLSRPPPLDPNVGQPISSVMAGYLSGVSNATLNSAINAQGVTPLQNVTSQPLTSNGKPEFLYIGTEWCPFCAAERWSIIVALSKFGTFSGLEYMLSSSTDVDANTPTFSFVHSSFTSSYITFVSVETQDRNRNRLQSLTTDQQALQDQLDPGGGIPFIDVGGLYVIHCTVSCPTVHSASQYDPGILAGQNWTQIGSQLDSSGTTIAQHVDGAADQIISAICKVDNGKPSGICSQQYAQIPISQSPIGTTQLPPTETLSFFQASDMVTVSRKD